MDYDQIYRKKIGFGSPINLWMDNKGKYSQLLNDTLGSAKFANREFVNKKHFNDLFKAYQNGRYKEHNCSFLWTYLNLELWYQMFFEEGWKKGILEFRI